MPVIRPIIPNVMYAFRIVGVLLFCIYCIPFILSVLLFPLSIVGLGGFGFL